MSELHLDDEALSAYLDGEAADAAGVADHLAACPECAARLAQFQTVAAAVGAPPAALDRGRAAQLVASALSHAAALDDGHAGPADSSGRAAVVPIGARRVIAPWIAAAAAAVVLLAGVTAAVRMSRPSRNSTAALSRNLSSEAARNTSSAGAVTSAADAALVDGGDLGDQSDPNQVTRLASSALGTTSTAFAGAAPQAAASGLADAKAAPSAASPTAPPTTIAAEARSATTAMCLAEARSLTGGSVGALRLIASLRWKGQDGELLVFDLTAPGADGPAYRALVLRRPGCEQLADLRF